MSNRSGAFPSVRAGATARGSRSHDRLLNSRRDVEVSRACVHSDCSVHRAPSACRFNTLRSGHARGAGRDRHAPARGPAGERHPVVAGRARSRARDNSLAVFASADDRAPRGEGADGVGDGLRSWPTRTIGPARRRAPCRRGAPTAGASASAAPDAVDLATFRRQDVAHAGVGEEETGALAPTNTVADTLQLLIANRPVPGARSGRPAPRSGRGNVSQAASRLSPFRDARPAGPLAEHRPAATRGARRCRALAASGAGTVETPTRRRPRWGRGWAPSDHEHRREDQGRDTAPRRARIATLVSSRLSAFTPPPSARTFGALTTMSDAGIEGPGGRRRGRRRC